MKLISLLLALGVIGLADAAQPCSKRCPTGYGWINPPPYGGHATVEESYEEGSCLTLQWKSPWPDVRIAYVSKEGDDFVYIEQNETSSSQHWDVNVTECPSITDSYYMYFEDVENPEHHCWSNLWSVTPHQGSSSSMSSSSLSSSTISIPYHQPSSSSNTPSSSLSEPSISQTQNTPISSRTVPGSLSQYTSSTSHTSQSPSTSNAPPTSYSPPTSTKTTPPSPPSGSPSTSNSPPTSSTSSSSSSSMTSSSATSGSSITSTIVSETTSSSASSSIQTSSTTSYTCTTIFQPIVISTTTVTATVVTVTTTAISTQTVIISYPPPSSVSTFTNCNCPTATGCISNGQNSIATLTVALPTITPTAAPANSTSTTTPFPVLPDNTPSTSIKIGLGVGFGFGILAIGALAGCCFFCLRRKRRRDDDSDCEGINNNVDVEVVNVSGGGVVMAAGEATAAAEATAIARGGYAGVYGEASKNQYGVVTEERCGSRGSSMAYDHTEFDASAGNGIEIDISAGVRGGAATRTDMASDLAIDAAEAAAAALIVAGLAGRRSSHDSRRSQRSCRSRGGSSEYSRHRWFAPRRGSGAAILTMSGAVEEFDAESGRYRFADDEAVILGSNERCSDTDRRSEAEVMCRSASEGAVSSVSRQRDRLSGDAVMRGLWCDCRPVDPFSDAGNTCRCGLDVFDDSRATRASQNVDFFSTFKVPSTFQESESSRAVIYNREVISFESADASQEENASCEAGIFHRTSISRGFDVNNQTDIDRGMEVTREIHTFEETDSRHGIVMDQHATSVDMATTMTDCQETKHIFTSELRYQDGISSAVKMTADESEEITMVQSTAYREGITSMVETVASEEEITVWVQSKVEGLPSNIVTREVGGYEM